MKREYNLGAGFDKQPINGERINAAAKRAEGGEMSSNGS